MKVTMMINWACFLISFSYLTSPSSREKHRSCFSDGHLINKELFKGFHLWRQKRKLFFHHVTVRWTSDANEIPIRPPFALFSTTWEFDSEAAKRMSLCSDFPRFYAQGNNLISPEYFLSVATQSSWFRWRCHRSSWATRRAMHWSCRRRINSPISSSISSDSIIAARRWIDQNLRWFIVMLLSDWTGDACVFRSMSVLHHPFHIVKTSFHVLIVFKRE